MAGCRREKLNIWLQSRLSWSQWNLQHINDTSEVSWTEQEGQAVESGYLWGRCIKVDEATLFHGQFLYEEHYFQGTEHHPSC